MTIKIEPSGSIFFFKFIDKVTIKWYNYLITQKGL